MKKTHTFLILWLVYASLPTQSCLAQAQLPTEEKLETIQYLIRSGQRTESQEVIQKNLTSKSIQKEPQQHLQFKILDLIWRSYYEDLEDTDSLAQEAIDFAKQYKLEEDLPQLYFLQGRLTHLKSEQNKSTNAYEQAIQWATKLNQVDKVTIYQAYLNDEVEIFRYGTTREFFPENVLPTMEEALSLQKANKDTAGFVQLFPRYVEIVRANRSQDAFHLLLNEWEDLLPQYKDLRFEMIFYSKQSSKYQKVNDLDRAEWYLQKSLALSKILDIQEITNHYYFRLNQIYRLRKSFPKALTYLDSIKLFDDVISTQVSYHLFAYETYDEMGQPAKSLYHMKKWKERYQEGLEKYRLEDLTKLETRFNLQEKELQIKNQRTQNRNLLIFIGFGLIALVFIVLAYNNQRRAKEQLAQQNEIIAHQSQELRQLDEVKSRFFANVSHELRTPVTLVLGPLTTLLKSGELKEKNQKLTELGVKNAKNLLKMVNEILDLTRMESGKVAVEESEGELHAFLSRITQAFVGLAEQQKIDYRIDLAMDESVTVQLDFKKVEKILNNLLSNAFKFTNSGEQICFITKQEEEILSISIQDTGRGIHPKDLPYIFDRFYQSSLPNAPKEGGTGIGLSLSQEFAKLLQAKLYAESQFGKGSTFYLQIPLKINTLAKPTPNTQHLIPNTQSPTANNQLPVPNTKQAITNNQEPAYILLVEDNEDLREFIQLIIGNQHHLQMAENGKVAWEQLVDSYENPQSETRKPQLPQLIISDIMMPEMDGYQLLDKLKANEQLRTIPVIMLTALAELKDKLKALRIGVDDYMTKPFEEEELIARINNLLRNSKMRQEYYQQENNRQAIIEEASITASKMPLEESHWLEQVETLVKASISNFNFTVAELAHQLSLSKSSLERKLKKETGLTPSQYIQEIRYNEARYLLETKAVKSVKNLAYQVGIKSTRNFSKNFKTRFGRLPSDYFN